MQLQPNWVPNPSARRGEVKSEQKEAKAENAQAESAKDQAKAEKEKAKAAKAQARLAERTAKAYRKTRAAGGAIWNYGGRGIRTGWNVTRPVRNAAKGVVGAGAGFVVTKASEAGSGAIFIFLSILMYFIDMRTRFNGLMIRDFSIFTNWHTVPERMSDNGSIKNS